MKLVIEDRQGAVRAVGLASEETSLGRGEGNDVRLDARNVSRRHARLRRDGAGFSLEDLGSLTGVRVNGERIAAPTPIAGGDVVEIGDFALALAGDEAALPSGLRQRVRAARLGEAAAPGAIARSAPPPARAPSPAPARPRALATPSRLLAAGAVAASVLVWGAASLRVKKRDPLPAAGSAPTRTAEPSARRAFEEGEARLRAHDAGGAIDSFQRAIALKPDPQLLGLAYRGLGMAYVAAGDGRRGAAYLRLYLPLSPASERPMLEEAIARYEH